ncbi:23932_t:CDS:2, partial [Dentiscutata erythropus]
SPPICLVVTVGRATMPSQYLQDFSLVHKKGKENYINKNTNEQVPQTKTKGHAYPSFEKPDTYLEMK